MAYIAVVPIVITVILIAPYKLWKQKISKIAELTQKKLRIEIAEYPELAPPGQWWHLLVCNDSNVPISDCYGRVRSFTPNRDKKPYEGVTLPWSSWSTRDMQRMTIPGKDCGRLDFVLTDGSHLFVVALSIQQGIRTQFHGELPGRYEVEVQVGSEKEASEPSIARLSVELDNSGNLHVQKLHESNQP